MTPATQPIQRPANAKLLVVSADGTLQQARRAELGRFLEPGDLLVANDAATLPGSLRGIHQASGQDIEIRLAGRDSLDPRSILEPIALALGAGDHRTPTERRPLPPVLRVGDRLLLGPLSAKVQALLDHPRLLRLRFEGSADQVWAGIARHGRPIQYAYMQPDLAVWDVWTRIAAVPAAFEAPSAGFLLDWQLISELKRRQVHFATLTHAAGISSTGDPELDQRLPLDEPYFIPEATVHQIRETAACGGRVIALGTTVARALEHAAKSGSLLAGAGLADQRIGPHSELRVVDALISGVHEAGESHYQLLRAFIDDELLARVDGHLATHDYRNHEFGDSVLLERRPRQQRLVSFLDQERLQSDDQAFSCLWPQTLDLPVLAGVSP